MNISIDFIDFSKMNFSFVTLIGGIFIILLGILYYLIYHKHHKRNQVELFELVELVTKFYVRTIILILSFFLSAYFIAMAVALQEERTDVIGCVVIAIAISSASIISYRKYIKLSLLDYDLEIRASNNERKLKIGEVLEVICFIICILAPIWRIPGFIEIFDDKYKLAIEIIKTFVISIAGLVLMFAINPMNIKRFFVEEQKEENEEKKTENKTENKAKKKTENKDENKEKPVKKKRGRPKKNLEKTEENKKARKIKKKD